MTKLALYQAGRYLKILCMAKKLPPGGSVPYESEDPAIEEEMQSSEEETDLGLEREGLVLIIIVHSAAGGLLVHL